MKLCYALRAFSLYKKWKRKCTFIGKCPQWTCHDPYSTPLPFFSSPLSFTCLHFTDKIKTVEKLFQSRSCLWLRICLRATLVIVFHLFFSILQDKCFSSLTLLHKAVMHIDLYKQNDMPWQADIHPRLASLSKAVKNM